MIRIKSFCRLTLITYDGFVDLRVMSLCSVTMVVKKKRFFFNLYELTHHLCSLSLKNKICKISDQKNIYGGAQGNWNWVGGGRFAKTSVWPLEIGFIEKCHRRKTFRMSFFIKIDVKNSFLLSNKNNIKCYLKKMWVFFFSKWWFFWSKHGRLCVLEWSKLFYLQQKVDVSRDILLFSQIC